MGKKPNRAHRAAKQRARQGGSDFWITHGGVGARSPEQAAQALAAAALETAKGETAERFATELAGPDSLTAELEHGAHLAGQHVITRVFENGWLPADIHEAARRRVDEFAVSYVTDVLAAYLEPYPAATIDDTWHDQLEAAGVRVWWSTAQPHLSQWAGKQLLTPVEALTAVIQALALLLRLPKLELIRPLPGTVRRSAADTPHRVDDKALTRVRGLLAKAESTSFPEEAEALSAKAQELMTKYAIDRVLVEARAVAADLPGARRIWLDTPYVDAKALLVEVVTHANRCRAIFSDWGFTTVVGDEPDLDAVELLVTSLLVQATRAMIAGADPDPRDAHSRTRSFRKSFLLAYATRIGERLAEANEATIAESAEPEHLLPVLASHQAKVDKAFDSLFPAVAPKRTTIGSAAGWDAGRAAADRAQLQPR
ncbi:DUF2786 domain-containing protein [Nocardia sp. XZ_19_385]|uniref:DUF2786 domain-containing protein n=1 Tax=Nocardia sp. XZ_19_385 TaxID=2769488 RepID=UPI00188DC947|nr:DUF2786 domain-containing protein [Nocardia sp. XZ_19_385]